MWLLLASKKIFNIIDPNTYGLPCLFHSVDLLGTRHGRLPARPLRCVQLSTWSSSLKRSLVVQNSGLDDLHVWESLAVSVEGATTFAAEVAVDGLATVGLLCKGLWRTSDFKLVVWDDQVGGECTSGNLLAVFAVAECLVD